MYNVYFNITFSNESGGYMKWHQRPGLPHGQLVAEVQLG